MNVKANLAILELPEVEQMYVFPSCGDESNSIGAAAYLAAQAGESVSRWGRCTSANPSATRSRGRARSGGRRERPLRPAPLRVPSRHRTKNRRRAGARPHRGARLRARRIRRASPGQPLHPGARRRAFAGARLNHAIKGRDFWMPFAPSVLAERAAEYYEKPKPVASPLHDVRVPLESGAARGFCRRPASPRLHHPPARSFRAAQPGLPPPAAGIRSAHRRGRSCSTPPSTCTASPWSQAPPTRSMCSCAAAWSTWRWVTFGWRKSHERSGHRRGGVPGLPRRPSACSAAGRRSPASTT